jgi:hypothetical protein
MVEQMNSFQAKFQEQLKDVQAKAATRAKEVETEARKAFQTLNGKARGELKGWLDQAEQVSREGLHALGIELVKLGKRLQEIGKHVEQKSVETPKADA